MKQLTLTLLYLYILCRYFEAFIRTFRPSKIPFW